MFDWVVKALLLTFSVSGLLISGCGKEAGDSEEKQPLRPVRYMVVESPDTLRRYEFAAVVDASRKADLSFKVSGEIIDIFIRQGSEVKAGQVLAKLDDADIKLYLKEAQSNFEKSDADYK